MTDSPLKSVYSFATPKDLASHPSGANTLYEGAFSDLHPTIGHAAKTSFFRACNCSRTPGTARIGPMLISGLLGQMMTRLASLIASNTPGAGRAALTPRN